jgi:zinc/manganese transport system ATP-binding protein
MGGRSATASREALAAVGLNGFENRNIGTLSGGQMQRMLFARVLLQDARLIVLTSPSTPSTPKPARICSRWSALA